jgi:hypothetical protein
MMADDVGPLAAEGCLMPVFSEMPVPMLHEVRLTMVLRSQ